MALIGLVTTEGLNQITFVRNNAGYFVYPTKFSVSATAGDFNISRTIDTLNSQWYTGLLSGYNKLNALALELIGTIPPNSNSNIATKIAEIYYFCESEKYSCTANTGTEEITIPAELYGLLTNGDRCTLRTIDPEDIPAPIEYAKTYYVRKISSNVVKIYNTSADALANTNVINLTASFPADITIQKEFLFSIAQPNPEIEYLPTMGSYTLRPSIILANSGDPDLFTFIYTQSEDIADHNLDLNAHPNIQSQLNNFGIFIQPSQHDYVGQPFDEKPIFETGASANNTLVYVKTNGKYEKALADGTIKEDNLIGIVVNGNVKSLKGFFDIGTHGFSIGSKVYLSSTVAGEITSSASTSEIGIAVSTTTVYLDRPLAIDVAASGVSAFTDLSDVPGSYSGSANKIAKVNSGATGIEFVTLDSLVPDSTESLKGKIEIATQVETDGGVDDSKAVTPLKLKTYVDNSLNAPDIMPWFTRFFSEEKTCYIDDFNICVSSSSGSPNNLTLHNSFGAGGNFRSLAGAVQQINMASVLASSTFIISMIKDGYVYAYLTTAAPLYKIFRCLLTDNIADALNWEELTISGTALGSSADSGLVGYGDGKFWFTNGTSQIIPYTLSGSTLTSGTPVTITGASYRNSSLRVNNNGIYFLDDATNLIYTLANFSGVPDTSRQINNYGGLTGNKTGIATPNILYYPSVVSYDPGFTLFQKSTF